jgi:hypothetical protein
MFKFAGKNNTNSDLEKFAEEEYERAVEKIYKYTQITLAIARMEYYEGFGIISPEGAKAQTGPDNYSMNGVIHEEFYDKKRIWCDFEFTDDAYEENAIGHCELTHFGDSNERKKQRYEQPLALTGYLYDPDKTLRVKVYNAIRDAAISGNQFLHFRLIKEKQDPSQALEKVKSQGYGPRIKIIGFQMWPEISLPNAPAWGSKKYYDN